jgi:arabinoxylan arabinofuranohydrolase
MNSKFGTTVAVLAFVSLLCSAVYSAENFTSYLFAYFTGNKIEEESIRFAISDDAHSFKALNGNKPVISSTAISSTGGIRDPHILRGENNDYYMVATDMVSAKGWDSNRGLVMLKSTNLIDWQSGKVNIPTSYSQYSKADRVWAPQTIYDPAVKKYMVYFAMRLGSGDADKIYYAYANSTFTALESAPKLLYQYNNLAAIDADIIYKDSQYYLFFKTEGSGNGIKYAVSSKLTEGYVLYDKYLQLTTAAVEGSCVFKLNNSSTYVLMYDVYTSGRYEFAQSTDFKNFTADKNLPTFNFTPRHGTIISITAAEKNALNAKWNPTNVADKTNKSGAVTPFGIRASNEVVLFPERSGIGRSSGYMQTYFTFDGRIVERSILQTDNVQGAGNGSRQASGMYLLKGK